MKRTAMGLGVWAVGLALALGLPGSTWKQALPPVFPWACLGPTLLALAALSMLAPFLAWMGGPGLAHRRALALLEAPPDLLWAGLLLALWPAVWGPPGIGGWLLAFWRRPCPERPGGWPRPCPVSGPSPWPGASPP